uniref:Uncharacterized protein n=1 Tax=Chromera velia CCMP2878 TaxID=1169474 RepID=A0A0G4FVU4_9ALVE|eukprot:Cvel_474.t1-p1 / transcript=Cvel_474.t1 / gene=Cvel_474 / organism=Chromera_velia_CCMP2878 / gene_product=hypothetical protein / transcript_product=hypothetical protein / location=Cvel_scaffold15:48508-48906(+) / protein_length=133 / sequence_SO=supercontig / SO=protein_coding / is_pseudo=false
MKGTKKEIDSAEALDFLKRVEIATEVRKQELVSEQVVNFVVGCLCIDRPIKTIGQDRDRTDAQRDVRLAQLIKRALDALAALSNQMVEDALDKDPEESLRDDLLHLLYHIAEQDLMLERVKAQATCFYWRYAV